MENNRDIDRNIHKMAGNGVSGPADLKDFPYNLDADLGRSIG